EHRDRHEVQHGDPLVVLREEPRLEPVRGVEIALAFRHFWSHDPIPSYFSCAVAAIGLLDFSDFKYVTSCSRFSSLTMPWKAGMIGWKPCTTLACEFMIDSRR